jgi:hypothetical protein
MAEHLPCASYALLPTNARETAHAIIALQKHKEWLLNRRRLHLYKAPRVAISVSLLLSGTCPLHFLLSLYFYPLTG